jgi:predicted RNase H-like HicB family nuclease
MDALAELIFDVSIDEDGRYVAQARDTGIATDGASWQELKAEVKDLIACYYGEDARPSRVRLVHAEELAVA